MRRSLQFVAGIVLSAAAACGPDRQMIRAVSRDMDKKQQKASAVPVLKDGPSISGTDMKWEPPTEGAPSSKVEKSPTPKTE